MSKDTICRAVTFPFTPHSCDWPAFDELIRDCWHESTSLANWAVLELVKHDVTRTACMEKLPAYPPCSCKHCSRPARKGKNKGQVRKQGINLYGHFQNYEGRAAWAGAAAAAGCVLRAVERKYQQERFGVLWRRDQSLCTYRYPYPFPVHNQNWSARYGKDRAPLVELSLPGGAVTLRLRGGSEMRRQLAGFAAIVNGARVGEAAVYRRGDRTMLKLVCHLPRKPAGELTGTLCVRTDPNAFWVSEQDGRQPWIVNADHVRRWIASHTAYRQRMSEDLKFEKRWPAEVRRHMLQSLDDRCRKQNDRLTTWCHEASKMLAEFARRQKVAEVIYDDANKDYLPMFPWFKLREMVRNKLDERGIILLAASGEVVEETPGTARVLEAVS